MANAPSKLIVILAAVLLAVVAASGAVLWLLPGAEQEGGPDAPDAPVSPAGTEPSGVDSGASFNTTVLRTSRYTALDQQLVTDGSLPVQPPATVGKANPFL